MLIALIPVVPILLIRLFDESQKSAIRPLPVPSSVFDFSFDLAFAGYGLALSSALASPTSNRDIVTALAAVVIVLFLIFFFQSLPTAFGWEWVRSAPIFWSVVVPDLIGLAMLAVAAKASS